MMIQRAHAAQPPSLPPSPHKHTSPPQENRSHLAAALQEQPVGLLHDVGLVDGADLGALVVDGVLERVLGDARRRRARDYLFVFFVFFWCLCFW